MRTDSVHVPAMRWEVRDLIPNRFGANYLPEKPNFYKSKKTRRSARSGAATDVTRAPEDVRRYLEEDAFKLYQLIWQRFVGVADAAGDFDRPPHRHHAGITAFRANGSVQKFDGFAARVPDARGDWPIVKRNEKDDEGEGRNLRA